MKFRWIPVVAVLIGWIPPAAEAAKSTQKIPIYVYLATEPEAGPIPLELADRYAALDHFEDRLRSGRSKRLRIVDDPHEAHLFLELADTGRSDGNEVDVPFEVTTTGSSATASTETLKTDYCVLEARLWADGLEETIRAVLGTSGTCWWASLGDTMARRVDRWVKKNRSAVASSSPPAEIPAAARRPRPLASTPRTIHLFARDPDTPPGGWRQMKPKLAVAGFIEALEKDHSRSLRWVERPEEAELVVEIVGASARLTGRGSVSATVSDDLTSVDVQNQYRNTIEFTVRLPSGETVEDHQVTFTSPLPNALGLGTSLAERLARWARLLGDEAFTAPDPEEAAESEAP